MNEPVGTSQVSNSEKTRTSGFFRRLIAIWFEPGKTFEDIHRKGSWLGIFLLVSALLGAASYLIATRMDAETFMRKGLEMNPLAKRLSDEQIQQILSRPVSPLQKYSGAVFAPVGVLISYVLVAGALLLTFVLMGAAISFKKSLAVTAWGLGPPSVIHVLIAIVLVLAKDPNSLEINVVNNVVSSPAILIVEKDHPVLHSILSSLDLFSFWAIYLLSVGFATVSDRKLTAVRAAIGVMIPWGMYVLGKVALAAFLG